MLAGAATEEGLFLPLGGRFRPPRLRFNIYSLYESDRADCYFLPLGQMSCLLEVRV